MAKNEAKIKFTAETSEFNDSIKKANNELGELRAELKHNEAQMQNTGASVELLERKHSLLEGQLKASQAKTEALSAKVKKAAEIFGEDSDEVSRLKVQLSNAQTAEEKLKTALKKCTKEIEDQTDSSKDAENALEDMGDAAGNTDEGFTVAKGAIADLASNAIQMAIGKIKEFIDYLMELPEATREIRQDMATLETSFETQGFSTQAATDTWKELYKVFGEDDRAVEAANLISKMSDNQKDLNDWVTITKGVWGQYQDSLPVEGLAEASNETAKTGQVTGVLADALNWSGEAASMFSKYMSEDVTTAEDAFNEALKDCSTEQERQALITETLTALYGDSAKKYEEASGAQIAAKDATAENILIQNQMADEMEPVTTAWQGMKNELAVGFLPVIQSVAGFLSEHPALLKAIAVTLTVLAVAVGAIAIAWGVYSAAQWIANAALLACPITWIVLAIVALIAVIVVIIAYWDELKAAAVNCWEGIKNVFSTVVNFIKENWQGLLLFLVNPIAGIFKLLYDNCDGFRAIVDKTVAAIKGFFVDLWSSIVNVWNNIVNAVRVAIMFIGSIISAAWNIITLPFRFIWENCKQYVFAAFEWIKQKISNAVQAIKNIFATIKNFFANVWNGVKNIFAPVANWFREKFQAAKNAVQNAWSSVKNFFSNIWNGIKTVFSNVGSWFREKFQAAKSGVQNAWSSVTGFFTRIKDKIVNGFANIKEKLSAPFKAAIDKIKGFFNNLKLKFPNIKMPHFSITGKFSLNPPSVPKLGIEWYKDGGIFTKPTIFGTPYGFKGVGEAGAEAVLPIDRLQGYITGAIAKTSQTVNLQSLADAIEDLANRPIRMNINGKEFALATAGDSDSVNGLRTTFTSRGLILD